MDQIRYINEVLSPDSLSGKRCFVVAGGPSLRDFDFSLLRNECTIGVNRAYEKLKPTIHFSMDPDFFGWSEQGKFGPEALEKWNNLPLKVFLDNGFFPYPPDVVRVKASKGPEPCFDLTGMYSGPNSGYGAIALAVSLGCKEIYVLGLDMHGVNGKQGWWHNGYPTELRGDHLYTTGLSYFDKLASALQKLGVKVVNLSPNSALNCFPKAHWSTVFRVTYVRTYLGYGDNVYCVPFVEHVADSRDLVYIDTPFPQLYRHIDNARFLKCDTKLNAQTKAAEEWQSYSERPQGFSDVVDFYQTSAAIHSVPERHADFVKAVDVDMTMTVPGDWIQQAMDVVDAKIGPHNARPCGKLCVVKQPTFRKEWYVNTRNPKPEYLQYLVDRAKEAGYYTVSLADLREGEEWADGEELNVDLRLHHGELDVFGATGLLWLSDLVIGYPSFFLPVALALKKPSIFVYGGLLPPRYFTSEKLYDMSLCKSVTPEPFCPCGLMVHKEGCNKEIPMEKLAAAFDELERMTKC